MKSHGKFAQLLKRFKPSFWGTLIAFVLFAILLSLGFWQLQRAKEKSELLFAFNQMRQSPARSVAEIGPLDQAKQYQPIKAEGEFDNAHSFLLDNRMHQGRLGYEVITPLNTPAGVILINRGWIPIGRSRRDLPTIVPVEGSTLLTGHVYRPLKAQWLLGPNEENPGEWPRVIQRLDFAKMALALNKPVADFVLRLEPTESEGFIRDWQIITMPPEKHRGYALQWFGLALALLAAYFAMSLKRKDDEDE